jgi:cobalt-zinc-cadmium efflux system protein
MSADVAVQRERRLRTALALNGGIVVLQVVVGFAASSLGLLADAGHNLTDVAALGVSLVAVRLARRPATEARSFGMHRGTILAAQVNAASVLVVCVLVAIEGVRRLADPEPVHGGWVLVVALLAAAVNLLAVRALGHVGHGAHGHDDHDHDDHDHDGHDHDGHDHDGHDHDGHDRPERDLNLRSASLHLVSDAAASVGVAVAGAVILLTGGCEWLDPVASLAISVLIGWQGVGLLRETAEVLLEATPAGLDLEALTGAIESDHGVEHVHDLHVWTLSSDVRALSAHLVLCGHPSLEEAQVVGGRVKASLAGAPFRIAHATLELECEPCGDTEVWCALDDEAAS